MADEARRLAGCAYIAERRGFVFASGGLAIVLNGARTAIEDLPGYWPSKDSVAFAVAAGDVWTVEGSPEREPSVVFLEFAC